MAFEIVPFDGDEILGIRDADGKAFVAVKRICENLKLGYESQFQKLKGHPWSGITTIVMPDARGYNQELCVIPLDSLPMWMATVAPGRVKAEVRDKLVRYQKEVRDVLARHFLGGVANVVEPIAAAVPASEESENPLLAQAHLLVQLVEEQIRQEKEIERNRLIAEEAKQRALEATQRSEVAELKAEETKNQIIEVNRKIGAVSETIVADTRWVTAMGFTKLHGIDRTVHELARDGKMLTALCRAEGIVPRKVHSEVFGEVNIYPEQILRRFYNVADSPNGLPVH